MNKNTKKENNILYKKKYLKYKNKYYKLSGGTNPLITYSILSLLLVLLIGGGYILFNQMGVTNIDVKSNIDKKTVLINFRKIFIEDLNKLISEKMDVKNYLDKYYKYANIHIITEIKKVSNEVNMNTIILNYILKNNLYSPFRLKNITEIEQVYTNKSLPDTFIICLLDIMKNNPIYYNYYTTPDYNRVQKDLINYIDETPTFSKYFEKDQNKINSTYYKYIQYHKPDSKNNTKNDYVQYMKTNEDVISDIPMIQAAAEYFKKYIIVRIILTSGTYIKIFKPLENKGEFNVNVEDTLEKNVIFLEYINLCDYYCDFVKEFNYSIDKNMYKDKNIKNKVYADTNKLYNIDNFNYIDSKLFTEKNKANNNINNNTNNEKNNEKNNEISNELKLDIQKKNYFNENNLNNLMYSYNLISDEKTKINKELTKRPYFQYYKLYNKEEIIEINKYIQNLLI